jgi:chromodomain-helicase-DNA-binding protein 7
MFDRASRKLGLERAVLGQLETRGHGDDDGGGRMPALSRQEVEELLRRGAYGALMDDEEGDKFVAEGVCVCVPWATSSVRYTANAE